MAVIYALQRFAASEQGPPLTEAVGALGRPHGKPQVRSGMRVKAEAARSAGTRSVRLEAHA